MSIVADLLHSSGKLEKENILLKVDDLKRKFEDIKLEVQENLKNRYIDFIPQYVALDKLIGDINDVTTEYEVLNNHVEKEIKPMMVNTVVEFNDVVEDLKKIQKLKEIAVNLSLQHNFLEDAKRALSQHTFLKSALSLIEFESVKDIDSDHQNDIAIVCALRTEFIVTKENLIYHLENSWHEKVIISSSLEGKKKYLSIKINKTSSIDDNTEILNSLKLMKQLSPVLKAFGKRFLNFICTTAVTNTVKLTMSEDSSVLTMTIIKEQAPEPSEVFETLKEIFIFLNEGILQSPLDVSEGEDQSLTTMNEFGISIEDEFCTLIIEKCLKVAVPKQSKKMESFYLDITAADNFCNFLQELGFFSGSCNKLQDFIRNVDILPVNQIAQDFLSRSRSCMKKSLYQTIAAGIKPTPIKEIDNVLDINEIDETRNGLSKSTFSFPYCQVSESIKELVRLLDEVKAEANNIGQAHVPRLYYVARHICELYCCVVPVYHKEEIANIPQQTAIFHNNCMYLAHYMCIMGTTYESNLQQNIQFTFVDLVPEIRKLGAEAFLTQMRHQKQQLLQLLQDQACGSILMDDSAVNKAEKSVRQCLCQLQLLKKVWSDVLPIEVYFKAIGTLFNTCLEEMIIRISSMEDIAAEAAAQLDSIFDIFLKQGPDLFMVSLMDKRNFIHLYVKRWFKFQELQLILSASMREIVDRWASGKGPLANHFTSEEVKHLIRALFQNTERRAAALAKIR